MYTLFERFSGKSVVLGVALGSLSLSAWSVPVTVLSENPGIALSDITVDGTNMYFTASNRILSSPVSGGTGTELYNSSSYRGSSTFIYGITHIGSDLFWGDAQSGPITDSQILKAPKSGAGPITPIYTGADVGQPIVDIIGLETDGTKLYAADAVQGRIHSLNPDGSGITQIGPNRWGGFFAGAHQQYIAIGDGNLFLAESAVATAAGCFAECNSGVYSHSGGGSIPILTGLPFAGDGPRGIAFGNDTLFVTQGDTVFSIDPTSGDLNEFTSTEFHNLLGLTFDDGSLYVLDNFADVGRVLRVDFESVPEPSVLALLLCGLVFLLFMPGSILLKPCP
jgi:hypothetical protein